MFVEHLWFQGTIVEHCFADYKVHMSLQGEYNNADLVEWRLKYSKFLTSSQVRPILLIGGRHSHNTGGNCAEDRQTQVLLSWALPPSAGDREQTSHQRLNEIISKSDQYSEKQDWTWACWPYRMLREVLSLKRWQLSWDLKKWEGCKHWEIREKSIPDRGDSRCKGPEVETHTLCSRNEVQCGRSEWGRE